MCNPTPPAMPAVSPEVAADALRAIAAMEAAGLLTSRTLPAPQAADDRQPEFGGTRPFDRCEGLVFACVACRAGAYTDRFLDRTGLCPECAEPGAARQRIRLDT